MIQALVFDLDDTLFLESDFVTSGYRAVARQVAKQYGCCLRDVFQTMMSVLATHGREFVFPIIIRRFLGDRIALSELVDIYRGHTPRIRLFPGYGDLLKKLGKTYKLGIITDGLPEVQKRKVHSLGLEHKVDRIIYTWEYGIEKRKPHPQSFTLMMDYLKTQPRTTLYVGDNPEKDCQGAHAAGMRCAQVVAPSVVERKSEPSSADKADYVLDSLFQLPRILQATEAI
ncbi:MAG TPA: HAD family hydrolase [Acidobacteriota bacterium]|nr:HAD family hydrolase [Acidobacteriota bacterium]